MDSGPRSLEISAILALMTIATSYHFWIHWEQMRDCHSTFTYFKSIATSWQRSQPTLHKKMQDLRANMVRNFLSASSHILIVSMVIISATFNARQMHDEKYASNWIALLTMAVVFYVVCRVVCDTKKNHFEDSRGVDLVFGVFHIALIVRVLGMVDDPGYFVFASNRTMLRIAMAIFHMSPLKTLMMNLAFSFVVVAKYENNASVWAHGGMSTSSRSIYSAELAVFMGLVFVSTCSYIFFRGSLGAQIQAERAKCAVQHLLSVLCDAVVAVGADGKVIVPTPHFTHLLSLSANVGSDKIDFKECLASHADRQAVDRALDVSESAEFLPVALHVHMRRSSGLPISVQLLIARLPDLEEKTSYLIGIREMTPMPREAEINTPGPPKNIAKQQHVQEDKRASASQEDKLTSSSSRSKRVPLKDLGSLTLEFDAFSHNFALQRLSIEFTGRSGRRGSMFCTRSHQPTIKSWIHPEQWHDFQRWTQLSLNEVVPSLPVRFGPIILSWPSGQHRHLLAQAIELVHCPDAASDEVDRKASLDESSERKSGASESVDEKFVVALRLKDLTQLSGYNQEELLNLLRALDPVAEHSIEM